MVYLTFIPFIALILIGVPIAFVLGFFGIIGLGLEISWGMAWGQLKTVAFSATAEYTLAVIPLFILMGNFASGSGVSAEAYNSARKWFGNIPGSLAIATNISAAFFGAISGSTMASASLFTKLSYPEMVKASYDKRLALGCIAAAGALACMIPPSILIVLYGIITGESIGELLIAGIIPGSLSAVIYAIGIYLVTKKMPTLAPLIHYKASWKEKFSSLKGLWPILALFALVMGGIYLGWFTPSEAAGVGAFGAFVIGLLRRRLSGKVIWTSIMDAGILSSALLIIIVCGTLYSFLLSASGVVDSIIGVIGRWDVYPTIILLLLLVMYLVLGAMIDPISMMIITMPIVYPLAMKLGFDPIWFGIFIVKMCEVAVLTPPLGMNLYAVKLAAEGNVDLGQIIHGTAFFLALESICITLLIIFPQIVTFLPNMMQG